MLDKEIRNFLAEYEGKELSVADVVFSDKLTRVFHRAYCIIKNKYPEFKAFYFPATEEDFEHIVVNIPSSIYNSIEVYLRDDGPNCVAAVYDDGSRKSLSEHDVFLNDPDNFASVSYLLNLVNTIRKILCP